MRPARGTDVSGELKRGGGGTVIAVSQVLGEADAGRSGPAAPVLLVLQQAVGGQPPGLGQAAGRSGALQQFASLQGNTVVGGPEVRRPGAEASGPAHYRVREAQVPQSQTLVAWRSGRGSSVTLILGGGGDTVHWMQAGVKGREGWRWRGGE